MRLTLSIFFGLLAEVLTVRLNDEITVEKKKCSTISEQAVNKCLQVSFLSVANCRDFQPILNYANSIQEKSGGSQFSLQGGDIFKKLCSLYSQFKVQ